MRWRNAAAIGLMGWLVSVGSVQAQQRDVRVTGRVVDADGQPVKNAEVGSFWNASEENGRQTAINGSKTDAEGHFTVSMDFYRRNAALMAIDADGRRGGIAIVAPAKAQEPVEIRLAPLVNVRAQFASKELPGPIPWTNVYINLPPDNLRLIQNSSRQAKFSVWLPPGEYRMNAYGSDVQQINQTLHLKPDQKDLYLGTLEIPATFIAQHKGKVLPPWSLADARGVSKNVTLDDYRGKWVIVDVWGYWCGPCVQQLAEMIDFYEEHAEHRDKFEILALHDGTVKDFAEMDAKTEKTKRSLWSGRDLPFPILLDAPKGQHGATVEAYGIRSFPTTLLIDPEGKLVGEASIAVLEKKLPPIPIARRIPRALDRQVAFGLGGGNKLDEMLEYMGRVIRIPIAMDEPALRKAGIEPSAMIHLKMTGAVSVRSWLALMLDPLGLRVVPGEKGLIVTTKPEDAPAVELSKPQRVAAARIEEKLKQPVTFDFQGARLSQVAAHFEQTTQENFVLDPAGLMNGTIDADAVVTGSAKEEPLRVAVERLLKPLGLKLVVKDEVVILAKHGD